MVHKSQQIRTENLKLVRQLIAKTGEKGAKHRYLLAVLGTTYGFHRRTANEYLEDLQDSGRIVYDSNHKVYRLPTEEEKK